MLKRIWRAIDLAFVVSDRAQQARTASRVTGQPMSLLYDGGLEVKAHHLLPHFHRGKPEYTQETRCVVGKESKEGELMVQHLFYMPALDSWRAEGPTVHLRSRDIGDLYLTEAEFDDVFCEAVSRLKYGVQSPSTEEEKAAIAVLNDALNAREEALRNAMRDLHVWGEQLFFLTGFIVKVSLGAALLHTILMALAKQAAPGFFEDVVPFDRSMLLFILVVIPPALIFFGRNLFKERANSAFDEVVRNSHL